MTTLAIVEREAGSPPYDAAAVKVIDTIKADIIIELNRRMGKKLSTALPKDAIYFQVAHEAQGQALRMAIFPKDKNNPLEVTTVMEFYDKLRKATGFSTWYERIFNHDKATKTIGSFIVRDGEFSAASREDFIAGVNTVLVKKIDTSILGKGIDG